MRDAKVKLKNSGITTILATSCWHIGNPSISDEGLHKFCERAQNHKWIHHGDIIEGIMRHDRRFSVDEHKETVLASVYSSIEQMKKANKTCVGLIKGNHDETPSRDIGDVSEFIAVSSRVPYLGAVVALQFRNNKGKKVGIFGHGSFGCNPTAGSPERRQLNRQETLRRKLSHYHADIVGIGHMHRFIVTPASKEEKLTYEDGALGRKPIDYCNTWYYAAPSMFKTYDLHADTSNYGEMAMYGATDIGWIEIDFDSNTEIKCIREVYSTGKTKQEHYPKILG